MRATGDRIASSSSPSIHTYVGARSLVTSTDVILALMRVYRALSPAC
jgi:hypothetical protein